MKIPPAVWKELKSACADTQTDKELEHHNEIKYIMCVQICDGVYHCVL